MRKYELTLVLPGGITVAQKKSQREKIEKILKALKVKVGKNEDWGEIKLAYLINKNSSGIFLHYNLELDAQSVKPVSDKLKLEESILRYLLVKTNG